MTEETLLEFPCQFSLKAFGHDESNFETVVFEIVGQFVEQLPRSTTSSRPSSKGKYLAVTVSFTAISKVQLDQIYQALSDHKQVVMAL